MANTEERGGPVDVPDREVLSHAVALTAAAIARQDIEAHNEEHVRNRLEFYAEMVQEFAAAGMPRVNPQ